MVNVDACHDYSYENTAKEPEILFDEDLFNEEFQKYQRLWDDQQPSYKERNTKANAWEKIAATFGKDGKISKLVNTCLKAQHFQISGKVAKSVNEKDLKRLFSRIKVQVQKPTGAIQKFNKNC